RVAVFGGAGLAHDLAALDRLLLIRRVFRVPVRHQLLGREQLRVRLVRVQHQEQGRPLVDDPHPRMAVPVDPPLVPLRRAEPPLQAQVVHGQARPIRAPDPDQQPPSPPPPAPCPSSPPPAPGTAPAAPPPSPPSHARPPSAHPTSRPPRALPSAAPRPAPVGPSPPPTPGRCPPPASPVDSEPARACSGPGSSPARPA